MRHPTEGVLRRLLDEPAGVADADRQHVADCQHCLDALVATRSDAALVGAALATDADAGVDLDDAWQQLTTAGPAPRPERAATPARPARWRGALSRPAAAALAVGVVLAGAGTAAANDWLQIFSTERITAVPLSTADLVALPNLSAYGTLNVTAQPDVHEVPNAAVAAADTGLAVPEVVRLPRGVSGDPAYQVGGKASATFTFSARKAAQAAAEAGASLPAPPAGVDGSSVRLAAGPGVAEVWKSATGVPALVVGRAVAPTAYSSGAPFEVLRDYLLSLPGLPDKVAEQLRTFTADGSTLPLPVPADQVSTRQDSVNGTPATVLETKDRTLAAVMWVNDGKVTVVAGSLSTGEVLKIARELQ
ncbi:hypothetical protein [Jatrophihabitans sp.]|uniref:hypothetical protein n=1 Tax=Jatrophihabitans sp. TaxID=1932789 RepID=UPI002CEB649F|nr:hypothetical protein [Jatrophihabitans sp.]